MIPNNKHTNMSDTSSIDVALEQKMEEVFDQNLENMIQYLKRLQLAKTEQRAEQALEQFYIALSEEDSRLSQVGREELKDALVEDEFAIHIILEAMNRRYSNARFYRRALSCLTYFIRDSEDHAIQFVELGGMEFLLELMEAFDKNPVIQWYCFDMLGKLVSSSESYDRVVAENLIASIVGTMLDMYQNTPRYYGNACDALVNLLTEKPSLRNPIATHVAGVSRSIVRECPTKACQTAEEEKMVSQNVGRLTVCHDILNIVLAAK